jgi:hypothetical protein
MGQHRKRLTQVSQTVWSCLRGQPTSHNVLKRFFDGIDLLLQLLQHRFEGLGQVVLGGHFAKLPISIRRMYLKNERLDVFQVVDILMRKILKVSQRWR